ncbi:hypothetical protein PSPO01_07926 [Paraphaeosphaeria sporulosa]
MGEVGGGGRDKLIGADGGKLSVFFCEPMPSEQPRQVAGIGASATRFALLSDKLSLRLRSGAAARLRLDASHAVFFDLGLHARVQPVTQSLAIQCAIDSSPRALAVYAPRLGAARNTLANTSVASWQIQETVDLLRAAREPIHGPY